MNDFDDPEYMPVTERNPSKNVASPPSRPSLRAYRAPSRLRGPNALPALLIALLSLLLYAATLLPGLGGGDTAEFQRVGPTLGLAHSTGYPLYSLLGWIWSTLLPLGSPAWRISLLSALCAALALAGIYGLGRQLGQRRAAAMAAALLLMVSRTFWRQATQAEVYALFCLLSVLLLGVALLWRAGRMPLWTLGLALGLGLAHHRMIILFLPALVGFILLTRRPRLGELGLALLATGLPCLLYLYVPWRAAPWEDGWQVLRSYLGASSAGDYLRPGQMLDEGLARPRDLVLTLIVPEFTIAGLVLGLAGAYRLLRRDRAAALLLLGSYLLIAGFCSAYYVEDLEVFMIGAQLIHALLIGEGLGLLADLTPRARWLGPLVVGLLLLALLPANLARIREHNTRGPELRARQLLGQPLQPGALVIGDGFTIESLRYLQAVEGQRPDLEFGFSADRGYIERALANNRAVYLLQVEPELGLTQQPEGGFLRVSSAPLTTTIASDLRWQDGLQLIGYSLEPGPYRPASSVPLVLGWRADSAPSHDYTLFVHIVDSQGTIWAQQDRPPASRPTSQWRPGERLLDLYTPQLAPNTPPGRYRVLIGWYEYPSLQRLQRAGPAAEPDYAPLAEIEVGG